MSVIAGDTRLNREDVSAQRLESRPIGVGAASDGNIDGRTLAKGREQFRPHELAQPTLESVAIDGGVVM